MRTFAGYHPLINFIYFLQVLVYGMVFMHPVCIAIALICSIASALLQGGMTRRTLLYMLIIPLIAAVVNPLVNHAGATAVLYFPDGNPLTMESLVYGCASAGMLLAVFCWFACYNRVMTSDKFLYLFGKIIPALSLVLSMILRFVPKFRAQTKKIADAQRCVGRDVSHGTILQRARHGITILSMLITWALESTVETADSMKARGYGTAKRTTFSTIRITTRDKRAGTAICLFGLYVLVGALHGAVHFAYFPRIESVAPSAYSISVFAAYFALCITPLVMAAWEEKTWKAIELNI